MVDQASPQRFVGIDMDSIRFDAFLKTVGVTQGVSERFLTTKEDLNRFQLWLKNQGDPIVSLEGFHGQNLVLERFLDQAGISYYSIPPFNVARFREASISKNKNNHNDAKAVASFALNQSVQGDLERYRTSAKPDLGIRTLTRRYHQLSKLITSEYSNLWKYLKIASADLYVAFKGKHPDFQFNAQCIRTKGVLSLLMAYPDLHSWSNLDDLELLQVMGGKHYVNRLELIGNLKKLAELITPISPSLSIPIEQTASSIRKYYRDKKQIERALRNIASSNRSISILMQDRGMGIMTASSIVAEIIDIRRFKNDDKLASYSGLGRIENKTGDNNRMRRSVSYNRYLKDAFMTAAVQHYMKNSESNYVLFYKQKISQGHSQFYARKALARALLRRIFRILKEVNSMD